MERCSTLNSTPCRELIAAAAEPLPEIDDERFGALFDRFADARVVLLGEASHGTSRILPRPRRHLAAADRAARLQHRRGRGRLARRRDDRPLRPPSARSAKARDGVPALPDLDVAQHRGRCLHPLAARPQSAPAYAAMCRLLRARSLQSRRLDAGGDRLSRPRRSGARAGSRTGATAASSRGPRIPQPTAARADRRLWPLRSRRRPDAQGPAAAAARLLRRPNATNGSMPRPMPGWSSDAEEYYRVMY